MNSGRDGASTPFSDDDVRQILEVVDRLQDVEVSLETPDFKLHVRKFAAAAAGASAASAAPLAAASLQAAAPSPAPARSLERSGAVAAAAAEAPAAAAAAKGAPSATAVPVRAPMLGRFFRAPSPTQPPYVEVGARVAATDPVCIIEVMKLFNTITAGVDGKVVRIDGVNGEMVEYDQALFWIEPA